MTSPRLVLPALLAVLVLVVACRHHSTHPRHGTHQTPTRQTTPKPLTSSDPLASKRGPLVQSLRGQPTLRIRIGRSLTTAALGSAGSVVVGPGSADLGKARPLTFQTPLRVSHDKQGFVLTEPNGKSVRWRLSTLEVTSNTGTITIGQVAGHPEDVYIGGDNVYNSAMVAYTVPEPSAVAASLCGLASVLGVVAVRRRA